MTWSPAGLRRCEGVSSWKLVVINSFELSCRRFGVEGLLPWHDPCTTMFGGEELETGPLILSCGGVFQLHKEGTLPRFSAALRSEKLALKAIGLSSNKEFEKDK
eukprot:2484357-Amphidinium_carterae.1